MASLIRSQSDPGSQSDRRSLLDQDQVGGRKKSRWWLLCVPVELIVAAILAFLDNWRPWLVTTIALILIAYGPIIAAMISNINLTSPGFNPLTGGPG